jgi:hypothetical protein
MAGHIDGRINEKLTMIMGDINTKIWFLLLAVTLMALCGCETAQVTRQNELAQSVRMVEAQYGASLTPEQKAHLAWMAYQQMEANRVANDAVRAQIIANGFQNAGQIIAEGSRQPTTVYVQQPAPVVQPLQIPPPAPWVPIPTSH